MDQITTTVQIRPRFRVHILKSFFTALDLKEGDWIEITITKK